MSSKNPFNDLPRTSGEHFKLYFYAAVSRLIERVSVGEFPFLEGYRKELAARGAGGADWWRPVLAGWENDAACHLPLRALRETAGLDHDTLLLLLSIGLAEEDVRFGMLFESLQGMQAQHRPTAGLLNS